MSAFVRAARFVGDLDDEFYADELQRDIWNEASAVGFQSLLWIGLISSAILPFAAGVTGAWVAVGVFVALLSASYVTMGYARARGVDVNTVQKLRRPRLAIYFALYIVGFGGAVVQLLAYYGGGSVKSLLIGVAIGSAIGAAVGAVGIIGRKRHAREAERAAEEAELLGFDPKD